MQRLYSHLDTVKKAVLLMSRSRGRCLNHLKTWTPKLTLLPAVRRPYWADITRFRVDSKYRTFEFRAMEELDLDTCVPKFPYGIVVSPESSATESLGYDDCQDARRHLGFGPCLPRSQHQQSSFRS